MAADNPRLIASIFDALDAGRLHDVAIREALIDNAKGLHGGDLTTVRKLDDDEGARYPLALLVKRKTLNESIWLRQVLGSFTSGKRCGPAVLLW